MQTLIGSFDSRANAEKVITELLNLGVPKDSITFLTTEVDPTSDGDSKGMGKVTGAFVGGVLGTAAATLLVPGIGPVLAIGVGAAALLGLGGAGAAVGHAVEAALDHEHTNRANSEENAAIFRKTLKQRRSLLIVRVDSDELARTACAVLDRTGLGMSA